MGISLKTEHLKRYKDIAWLLMKYGRSDLVKAAGLENVLDDESNRGVPPKAESLADDLEKMGSTFIKLGQLLSLARDLLPPVYMRRSRRLQDKSSRSLLKKWKHCRKRAWRAHLKGILGVRPDSHCSRITRSGAPCGAARWTPGGCQSAAARNSRADSQRS